MASVRLRSAVLARVVSEVSCSVVRCKRARIDFDVADGFEWC